MKVIWAAISIFLALTAVVVGFTLINRLSFDYNSEGNYFDESSAIVYNQQAISTYGLVTFILFVASTFLIYRTIQKCKTGTTQ